jgi:hypothetical protein
MTPLDGALLLLVAAATALGAHAGLPALAVALLALLAWPLLAPLPIPLALLAALAIGVVAATFGRALRLRRFPRLAALAGGIGGALLGVALVALLATAYPLQRDPTEPDLVMLHYPPRALPDPWSGWARDSSLLSFGAQVRLAPLAEGSGIDPSGAAVVAAVGEIPPVAATLHAAFARARWTWAAR